MFPDQPVAGQPAELGLLQQDFSLSVPLRQSPTDEWSASVRVRNQEFATGAVLPDTGEPFPDELWNIRFGTGYRHRFESGWIGALDVTVGSPSDKPFAGIGRDGHQRDGRPARSRRGSGTRGSSS